MRTHPLLVALLLAAPSLRAQSAPLTATDSALVYAILTAEDRRDARDSALALGAMHRDSRIVQLAARALARIEDSTYAERRNGPTYAVRVTWPLPWWRPAFDSLRIQRDDCAALIRGLNHQIVAVRLRAADLARGTCAEDEPFIAALIRRFEPLRDFDGTWRRAGPGDYNGTWQQAGHSLVALARLQPRVARLLTTPLASNGIPGLRAYVARAAGVAADTTTLRTLVADRDDNVKEAAIEELARLTGHADDPLFQVALRAAGAQAVRAAAVALQGSTHSETPRALDRALRRWLRRPNDSERDARLALLAAAGRPATEDRRWSTPAPLPRDVVALALGADVRLRVTMTRESYGGAFVVKLRGDVAPITAARILDLARRGYYDGMQWQRVVSDFVLQGGGPGANEYVGHPRFFRDELGTVSHLRGGVGMSTRGHDTGDAQWFFDLSDNARLDKDYTLFAEVVEGMNVVDEVMEGDRIASVAVVR